MSKTFQPPSIDDYLQLQDWRFEFRYDRLQRTDYNLLFSNQFLVEDLVPLLELPTDFLSVVSLNGQPGYSDGAEQSKLVHWKQFHENCHLYESLGDANPLLNFDFNRSSVLIFDRPWDKSQFASAYSYFDEPDWSNYDCDDVEWFRFWKTFELLQPHTFISRQFYITRQEADIQTVLTKVPMELLERRERERVSKERAIRWERLGPERGPETCVEDGCDRLRIALAVKCFWHQIATNFSY